MHRAGDAVAPLARPVAAIAVDDLLPCNSGTSIRAAPTAAVSLPPPEWPA